MSLKYNKNDINKLYGDGNAVAKAYYGKKLVYQYLYKEEHLKFKSISQDGTVYKLECDGNGTLTSGDTRGTLSMSDITGASNPMTSITIGDCVTEIATNALSGWTKITGELVIPDSVETVGNFAFRNCNGLTSLTLGKGLKTIGTSGFYASGFAGTLTLPTGLETIGQYAFRLTKFSGHIEIPNTVTTIGIGAFSYMDYVDSITIPESVTTINSDSISFSTYLKSIYCKATTPPTMEINTSLVFNFTNDCPIYVPCDSVNAYKSADGWSKVADRIKGWDFEKNQECDEPKETKFKRIQLDGTEYELPCNENGTLTSGETRSGLLMSDISGTTNPVTSITIGDCVTEIGNGAFSGWSKVTGELVIPDSVTTIGNNTFEKCSGLTSVTIGTGLTSIGNNAFWFCNGFTGNFTIPDSVTSIGSYVFQYCRGLTSITIGTGITEIGGSAFDACNGLTAVYCKATTPPTLGSTVFFDTNNCQIYVPCNSVDDYKAASGWKSYASRIKGWDFDKNSECSEQKNYLFKLSNSTNDNEHIEPCNSDGIITSGITNTVNKSDYNRLEIGDCCKEIGGLAFDELSNLQGDLLIPDSVIKIDDFAVMACGFDGTLTLGEGLKSIGEFAFYANTNLKAIYCKATNPPSLGDFAFDFTNDCPIYVPSAELERYKWTVGWGNYKSRFLPY